MFEPNVQQVLAMLSPSDVVLDIGGWASPFNRADWVMDAFPWETRGFYRTFGGKASQGGEVEHFTRDRWIQRDICGRAPYPFADKSLDFVICSHTLEDIRDPLWVCSEMIRIARRGYIEVPSRLFESTRGIEHPRIAGLSHHRWLIDIEGNSIRFLQKLHSIHTDPRFSFPRAFWRRLPEERKVQWLFWSDSFDFHEELVHGHDEQAAELAGYVRRVHPTGALRGAAQATAERVRSLAYRVRGRLERAFPATPIPAAELDARIAASRGVAAPDGALPSAAPRASLRA